MLAAKLGAVPREIVPDPGDAVARARELAGPDGAVVAAGSIYLVGDLAGGSRPRTPGAA